VSRFDIATASIRYPLYTWMLMAACLFGGLWGIDTVGRLENPEFPIKHAYVITSYPGASAVEVEQEVTDPIEAALQELPYLDIMTSKSVPGRSEIQVELLEEYGGDSLPQIWDELRRRVGEARMGLPPDTLTPLVEDDFGDIYGILYAISTPGYSPGDIHDISRYISSRLKLVPGVAKVTTAGEPREAVYVELNQEQLVRLGLPSDAVFHSIGAENSIVDAGSVAYDGRRLRVAPELAFASVDSIRNLRIGRPGSTEFVSLGDVAKVSRGPVEVPSQIIHFNGEAVFTVGVSVTAGQNVVDIGKSVASRLEEILADAPVGVQAHAIHEQHVVVSDAIQTFLKNLLISVMTVVGALCLFMGWRAGTVVGSVLLLTVLGTLALMSLLGIELQRISLGALMIAMGMLVDNAIVVAEGMVVGVERGSNPEDAAAGAVKRTQYPLLGATVIGLLAFGPIGLSNDDTGHFLRSLFQVVSLSLLLSWVLAITVVPLLGSKLLKASPEAGSKDIYGGWAYVPYRRLLKFGLQRRWTTALGILAITIVCLWSFGFVKQGFFPSTNSPLFYIDFYLPEGTDIRATAAEITDVEAIIRADEAVIDVTSFIGRGMTRYTATLRPEQPNPALAQIVVRVHDLEEMRSAMTRIKKRITQDWPDAQLQTFRSEFTPGGTSKIEARFMGPNPDVLRELGEAALNVYLQHQLIDRKLDWRQRELQIIPRFDENPARIAGISRADLYSGVAYATTGLSIGRFREQDKLLPIIARAPQVERTELETIADRLIWSSGQQRYIPVAQVVYGFDLMPADSQILRRQRTRTLTAQANVMPGLNVARIFNTLRAEVEGIKLPAGYTLEWGGEYEASAQATETLSKKIPMAYALMFLITILMFGKLRQPIVIWLTVPMVPCGVAISLLAADMSFTFPAFLGLLSLTGMLIKNCIVLVDEIDKRLAEETHPTLDTMVSASISRLRPVLLATGTTIAGMSPLLADAFFAEMAACIMGGLAFATLLTLIAVPVFYRIALGGQLTDTAPPIGI
jgi:multidrug efflux pump subunit AcrB